MKHLFLANLEDFTNEQVLEHLATEYSGTSSGDYSYGDIIEEDITEAKEFLKGKTVLIAYESVGDYGCDSSSFFLLKDDASGQLHEIHGSHCSCYGFEGQLDLEQTSVEALRYRVSEGEGLFYCGGYDNESENNLKLANSYVLKDLK